MEKKLNYVINKYNLDKEKTKKFISDCILSKKFYSSMVGGLLPAMSRFNKTLINGKNERSYVYNKVESELKLIFNGNK